MMAAMVLFIMAIIVAFYDHYVGQAGLKILEIHLPLIPESWH